MRCPKCDNHVELHWRRVRPHAICSSCDACLTTEKRATYVFYVSVLVMVCANLVGLFFAERKPVLQVAVVLLVLFAITGGIYAINVMRLVVDDDALDGADIDPKSR